MNQKQIIVISIVIILAVVACLTTFLLVNTHQESFTTLRISSSCTIGVPDSENTVEHSNSGVTKYIFNSSDLNITHQQSGNNSEIKSIKNKEMKNSKLVEGSIHYDSSTGIYSMYIENNKTSDALLITSSNLDLLKRVSSSVVLKNPENITISHNNTTDEVNEIQNDVVQEEQTYSYEYHESHETTNQTTPQKQENTTNNK